MPGIILHHYPRSPFAEKVRLALGLKRLEYASVTIPAWMPKPDLLPLTGGYRRTPVLQVGADVYCDTRLILRVLERMHPEPSLFPGGTEALVTTLGWGIEKAIFNPVIGIVVGLTGHTYKRELIENRGRFFGFSLEHEDNLRQQAVLTDRVAAHLATLSCPRCWRTSGVSYSALHPPPPTFAPTTRSGTCAAPAAWKRRRRRCCACCRTSPPCSTGWTASPPSATGRRTR